MQTLGQSGNCRVTRRGFLKSAAVSAEAVAPGGLIPSSVLGANGKIRVRMVGVGNMGGGRLRSLLKRAEADNIEVAAVCDVYQKRASRAKERRVGQAYSDYRRIFDRSDIDAVLIATPDHGHAKLAMDAMDAGKHGNGPVPCNVELGTATLVAIFMAVEPCQQRKTLAWDAKSEKVVPASFTP